MSSLEDAALEALPAPVRIGYRLWRAFRPWQRLKIARNKRRARLGKPLLPVTEDDMRLFPAGTMTYTGAGAAIATQVVTTLLTAQGIGECTPTELAANPGCMGATKIAGAIVTGLFAVVAIIGRKRAQRAHEAALAAAKAG